MAVHVMRGRGVAVYRFWPIPVLTPVWLDLSSGRLARWLGWHRLTRGHVVVLEDLVDEPEEDSDVKCPQCSSRDVELVWVAMESWDHDAWLCSPCGRRWVTQ